MLVKTKSILRCVLANLRKCCLILKFQKGVDNYQFKIIYLAENQTMSNLFKYLYFTIILLSVLNDCSSAAEDACKFEN